MKKFEYCFYVHNRDSLTLLGFSSGLDWYNFMGQSGWELVSKQYNTFDCMWEYIFKREILDPFPTITEMENQLKEEASNDITKAFNKAVKTK